MTNYQMTNDESMTNDEFKNLKNKPQKFDLEERTAKFGENVVRFSKRIPKRPETVPIISQLVRAGTSVGANYCEADDAHSKKDFEHKINICKKESRESKHWTRMVAIAVPELKEEARVLWKEAQELNLIFAKILRTSRKNKDKRENKDKTSRK